MDILTLDYLRSKFISKDQKSYFDYDLLPAIGKAINIGSDTNKLNSLYVGTLVADSIQAGGGSFSADKVDGFHASLTLTANYLLPLDADKRYPTAVFSYLSEDHGQGWGALLKTGDKIFGNIEVAYGVTIDGVDLDELKVLTDAINDRLGSAEADIDQLQIDVVRIEGKVDTLRADYDAHLLHENDAHPYYVEWDDLSYDPGISQKPLWTSTAGQLFLHEARVFDLGMGRISDAGPEELVETFPGQMWLSPNENPMVEGWVDKSFTFTQLSPVTTWTIAHELNKYPSVTVVDSDGNVVIGDLAYPDSDTAVLTFAVAVSGIAYLN